MLKAACIMYIVSNKPTFHLAAVKNALQLSDAFAGVRLHVRARACAYVYVCVSVNMGCSKINHFSTQSPLNSFQLNGRTEESVRKKFQAYDLLSLRLLPPNHSWDK